MSSSAKSMDRLSNSPFLRTIYLGRDKTPIKVSEHTLYCASKLIETIIDDCNEEVSIRSETAVISVQSEITASSAQAEVTDTKTTQIEMPTEIPQVETTEEPPEPLSSAATKRKTLDGMEFMKDCYLRPGATTLFQRLCLTSSLSIEQTLRCPKEAADEKQNYTQRSPGECKDFLSILDYFRIDSNALDLRCDANTSNYLEVPELVEYLIKNKYVYRDSGYLSRILAVYRDHALSVLQST
jgi:hypothetical protein